MAFYQIKTNNRVYVYDYDAELGRQKSLPRSQTKHLDNQPACNIEAWVRDYETSMGRAKPKFDNVKNPTFIRYVDDYCVWRITRKKDAKTIDTNRRCLLRYVLPYFLTAKGLTEPALWPSVAPKMLTWLTEMSVSPDVIKACNTAVRGFWQYLQDINAVPHQSMLRVIPPVTISKITPLKKPLTPQEVLDFVALATRDDIKIMALAGYFFSLRSQEVLAIQPSDFRGGTSASHLQCTKTMLANSLFGGLAVNVTKQMQQNGTIKDEVKSHSRGWVACFTKEAAQALITILNKYPPNEPIFKMRGDTHLGHWRQHGINAVTLKDLRRASLYWLGHYTSMGDRLVALKSHARHKKTETTELYLRRPEEIITTEWTPLSLEA